MKPALLFDPILWLVLSLASSSDAAELKVHVGHVESDRGLVCVAAHRTESGYLEQDDNKAFRLAKVQAHKPEVTVSMSDMPPGKYALEVFHDENGDGKLNRNFLGAPVEPYGISNNVRARYSLPSFADALIAVENTGTEIHIDLARH